MEKYRLIGVELSPYTVKLRAILRYRHIPHVWLCRFPQFFEETRTLNPGLMPVLQYPDGAYRVDSTFIAQDLEDIFSNARSIFPTDPALAFLAHLIEDMADEWLCKMVFHYRFSYDIDRLYGPRWVMDDTLVASSADELDRHYSIFLERQTNRMQLFGCLPEHTDLFETGYRNVLESLEDFVSNEKFLFGTRPSIADFALYGQLVTLMHDLSPGAVMRKIAPRTISWLMRLADTSGVDGTWLDHDQPSESLKKLLAMAGRIYLPYLKANANAFTNNENSFTTHLDGHRYTQPVFKYHVKCLNTLIRKFNTLKASDKKRLDLLLEDTNCFSQLMGIQAN